jgi:adenosylcobinamide kinase / adenosylcobinamide-phosphate guanylyltransferase
MKIISKREMSSRKVILIIGGARSGKSSFALKEASDITGEKAYIATAEALDDEMRERIDQHKKQRGKDWDTYEEPIKIGGLVKDIGNNYHVIVVDCLTLWLSNLMHAGLNITDAFDDLKKALDYIGKSERALRIYIVSNEVGLGIVPENELARRFRDIAGTLNQEIAAIADEVYMLVAGIPLKIKEKVK